MRGSEDVTRYPENNASQSYATISADLVLPCNTSQFHFRILGTPVETAARLRGLLSMGPPPHHTSYAAAKPHCIRRTLSYPVFKFSHAIYSKKHISPSQLCPCFRVLSPTWGS